MTVPERYWRWTSWAATARVEALAGVSSDPRMQDWALGAADPHRVPEFLELYRRSTDPDDRFALMDLILHSLDHSPFDAHQWSEVERLLVERPSELAALLIDWACVDGSDGDAWTFERPLDECFTITPLARRVLVDVRDRIGFAELSVSAGALDHPIRMESFCIEGDLARADHERIDVTVQLTGGYERWCYFVTTRALDALSRPVPGTPIRFLSGQRHMMVVASMDEQTIRCVLEHLSREARLWEHTLPVSGGGLLLE